jgi:hypothetical protein
MALGVVVRVGSCLPIGRLVVDLALGAAAFADQAVADLVPALVGAQQVGGAVGGQPGRAAVLVIVAAGLGGAGHQDVEAAVARTVGVAPKGQGEVVAGDLEGDDAVLTGDEVPLVLRGRRAGGLGAEEAAQEDFVAEAVAAVQAQFAAPGVTDPLQ